MSDAATTAPGLDALQARLAEEMAWLNLPAKPWLAPTHADGERVLDVAIVGAGLCGIVAAAALRTLGIDNVRLFDRAPAGREGPWITYARMRTLRTAKAATGPALGIPSLTFRAWFEYQHGKKAWEDMELAQRPMWMDYLNWYRRMTAAQVENDTSVTAILPRDDGLLSVTAGWREVPARRVVLATGLDGLGGPSLPAVARQVDPKFVAHSSDLFDLSALAGKRVGVVGAGASAMDNAAAALEAGAARVDIFVRRAELPRVDKFTGTGSKGMTHGFIGLPDDVKWSIINEGDRAAVPPPRHSVHRVARHANAHLHLASPVLSLREVGEAIEVEIPSQRIELDFLIFATGFTIDLGKRPELAALAPHILTWGDRLDETRRLQNPQLAASPYLNDDFTFAEKRPGDCPALSRIACFAYPAVPSHGKLTSGIPAVSDGADRLAKGLVRSLFAEDAEARLSDFIAYDTPLMDADEWDRARARDLAAQSTSA